jgi:hypothetical protein
MGKRKLNFRLVVDVRELPPQAGTTVSRSTLEDLDSVVEVATVVVTAEVSAHSYMCSALLISRPPVPTQVVRLSIRPPWSPPWM